MSEMQKGTETAASQEATVALERIPSTMAIGKASSLEIDAESLLGTPRRRSARLRGLQDASVDAALPLTPRRSRRKSSDSVSCSQVSSRAKCEETTNLSAITEEEPKCIKITKSTDSTNSLETETGAAVMPKEETETPFAALEIADRACREVEKEMDAANNDLEEVSNASEEPQPASPPPSAAAQKSDDEMKTISDVVAEEVEVRREELPSGLSPSDTTEAKEEAETQLKVSSDSDIENKPPPSDNSQQAERNAETVANAPEQAILDGERKEKRCGKGGNEAGNLVRNSGKVEAKKLGKSDHELAMSLGRKKSGKVWKSDRDRFRSVVKTKGLKQVKQAQKRIAIKKELLRVKEFERNLREEKKQKLDEIRRRQEENKRRRTENQLKSEIVEKITNPAKIKRMKKKQLRMLAKRDTTRVEK